MTNAANYRPATTDNNCNNCTHQTPDEQPAFSKTYDAYVPCAIDCWRKRKESGHDWIFGEAGVCDNHSLITPCDL